MSCFSSSSIALPRSLSLPSPSKKKKLLFPSLPPRRPRSPIASLKFGVEEIAGIAQNKVLVSAALAAAIGQLSKSLTSAVRGNGIDLKTMVRSGGMPSSHSSGVVAAATCLGLERGFSDSLFGMSVVFAAIVMYDAQGVRREVDYHAKILNRKLKAQEKATHCLEQEASIDSKLGTSEKIAPVLSVSEKANSYMPKANSYTTNSESYSFISSRLTSSGEMPSLKVDVKEISQGPLSESVGHTEIQVLVGAILGFVVSLTIETIL